MAESIEELKEKIALYEQNGAIGLYYELNRFVNGVVKLMRSKSIERILAGDENDPKMFEKTMALIKNAKEHTTDMAEMREKLNLTGDEEKDKRRPFITTVAQTRN